MQPGASRTPADEVAAIEPSDSPPGRGPLARIPPSLLRGSGPALLVATGLAMLAWTWRAWPDPIVDFGRELYVPWRLAAGDVLYRDIAWFNGPLSPYANALLFRLFGASLDTLVTANLILLVAAVTLVYRLLTRLAGPLAATTGGVLFLTVFAFGQHLGYANYNWVSPYSHEATHGLLLALAALAALDAWSRTRRPVWLAAGGAALGLSFLTKPEACLAGAAAALVFLVPAARRRPRALLAFAGAAAVPPVLAAALLSRSLPPAEALRGTLGAWPALFGSDVAELSFYRTGMGLDRPGLRVQELLAWTAQWLLLLGPAAALALVRRGVPAVRLPLALAAAGIVLVPLALARADVNWLRVARPLPLFVVAIAAGLVVAGRRSRRPPPLALALAVFSMVLLGKMILQARVVHYGFVLALPAALLVAVALVHWMPRVLERAGGHGVVFRTAALVLLAWGAAEHLLLTHRYLERKFGTLGAGADRFRVDLRGVVAADALDLVEQLAPRSLAVVPEGVMLNWLARVPNPTPYVNFMPPEMLLFGEEAWLAAFRAHPPDVILVVHKDTSEYGARFFGQDYARELGAWIGGNYVARKLLGDEPLRPDSRWGIRVLVRRRAP